MFIGYLQVNLVGLPSFKMETTFMAPENKRRLMKIAEVLFNKSECRTCHRAQAASKSYSTRKLLFSRMVLDHMIFKANLIK